MIWWIIDIPCIFPWMGCKDLAIGFSWDYTLLFHIAVYGIAWQLIGYLRNGTVLGFWTMVAFLLGKELTEGLMYSQHPSNFFGVGDFGFPVVVAIIFLYLVQARIK